MPWTLGLLAAFRHSSTLNILMKLKHLLALTVLTAAASPLTQAANVLANSLAAGPGGTPSARKLRLYQRRYLGHVRASRQPALQQSHDLAHIRSALGARLSERRRDLRGDVVVR